MLMEVILHFIIDQTFLRPDVKRSVPICTRKDSLNLWRSLTLNTGTSQSIPGLLRDYNDFVIKYAVLFHVCISNTEPLSSIWETVTKLLNIDLS